MKYSGVPYLLVLSNGFRNGHDFADDFCSQFVTLHDDAIRLLQSKGKVTRFNKFTAHVYLLFYFREMTRKNTVVSCE